MKVKRESEVAQSCPTLSDPMDCSLPSSSIHGIFQARVLEWGAIAFSVTDRDGRQDGYGGRGEVVYIVDVGSCCWVFAQPLSMSPGPLYSWTWRANTVVIMSRSGARDWVAWDVRTHLLRDVKTFQGLVVRCLVCGRGSVERWFNMSCNYIMPMSLALSTFLFPRLLISDLPIFYWLTSYSEIAVTLILGHFSIQFKMISMCTVEIPASLTSCFTPAINWAVVWELYVFIQTNTWCQLSLGESLDTLHFVFPCGISWFTTPIKPKYKVIWEPERSVHWDEVHLLNLLRSNPVRTTSSLR